MYYLFIIKDDYFKHNSKYLYEILYKIKHMHKENYNYGISLFYNICELFDTKNLNNYISSKYKLNKINNKLYLNKYNYFEIKKTYCKINNSKYLREILCIFFIYNKNIFVCDFFSNEYFWLRDKFK